MMDKDKAITEEKIVELLNRSQRAVERAIVVIYERQTKSEKLCSDTISRNDVGFSGCDAHRGSYYADWVMHGKHFTGEHLVKARKLTIKYRKQLVDAAIKKALASAEAVIDS